MKLNLLQLSAGYWPCGRQLVSYEVIFRRPATLWFRVLQPQWQQKLQQLQCYNITITNVSICEVRVERVRYIPSQDHSLKPYSS